MSFPTFRSEIYQSKNHVEWYWQTLCEEKVICKGHQSFEHCGMDLGMADYELARIGMALLESEKR